MAYWWVIAAAAKALKDMGDQNKAKMNSGISASNTAGNRIFR